MTEYTVVDLAVLENVLKGFTLKHYNYNKKNIKYSHMDFLHIAFK